MTTRRKLPELLQRITRVKPHPVLTVPPHHRIHPLFITTHDHPSKRSASPGVVIPQDYFPYDQPQQHFRCSTLSTRDAFETVGVITASPEHKRLSGSHSKMDSLVARYSRPAFEQHEALQEDMEDLTNPVPSISLKFAMPPIAQVRCCSHLPSCWPQHDAKRGMSDHRS